MKIKFKKPLALLASFSYLLCFIPAFNITYRADDLHELELWKTFGYGAMVKYYYTWTGKFGYAGLSTITKAFFQLWLPAVIALTVWWIALSLLMRIYTKDTWLSIGGAALFLTCLILVLPNRNENIYWQSALSSHTASVIAFTIYLVVASQKLINDKLSNYLCFFVSFFMCSFSEASIAFLPVVLLTGSLKRKIFGTVGATLSLSITLLSPGNAIRAASFPRVSLMDGTRSLLVAIPGFFKSYFVYGWFVLLLLSLAVFFVSTKQKNKNFGKREEIIIILSVLVTIGAVILSFAPAYVTFGVPIPERAYIAPQFIFFASLVVSAWTLGGVVKL